MQLLSIADGRVPPRPGGRALRIGLCLFLLTVFCRVSAAEAEPLRVYLLTMGPGPEVYEKFGHNAIWIHDPAARPEFRDVAFHYGLFDFDSTFIFRFIQKDLRYSMGGFDAQRTVEMYQQAGRWVRRQELNLSQQQIAELRDFLYWNAREENAYYAYDYYRDNCSTRVRDALDKAAGGQIRSQLEAKRSGATYRGETRRCLHADFAAMTAIGFMLSARIDVPLSQWERGFLPPALADELAALSIRSDSGERVPLVKADQWLARTAEALPEAPPQRTPIYGLIGVASAALLLLLHRRRQRRAARHVLGVALVAWCLFLGLSGLFLGYAMLCTAHDMTYGNENGFYANELSLLLAPLVAGALRGAPRRRRWAAAVSLLILAVAGIGLAAKLLLPARFPQQNWEYIAWLLPMHAAVVMIFRRGLTERTTPVEVETP